MRTRVNRHKTAQAAAFCLAISALLNLLCSQSSPLYPLNLWDDANCLLTVGRVMRAGGVLYRDIYEQKGPTLYLIHLLAACISDTSFLGVYVMQTLSWAASLFFVSRTLCHRLTQPTALCCAALAGALVMSSPCFMQGDSAEEFCLPFLTAAVFLSLPGREQAPRPMPPSRWFACGVLAGLVATVKYTVLGLFIGLCLWQGVFTLKKGGVRRACASALAFWGGLTLPVALWCAYFAANGALGDFLTAYLYNNIFLYDAPADTPPKLVQWLRLVPSNAPWLPLTLIGLVAYALCGPGKKRMRTFAPVAGVFCVLGLSAGRLWPYSVLPLWSLSPIALLGLAGALRRLSPRLCPRSDHRIRALRACATLASLGIALLCSPNTYLRGVKLSSLAQARLAAQVEPGATLLQYSHLDDGLYLLTGTLPQERYFVRLNVRCEDMIRSLDRYVEEARTDYVLVSWRELPARFDRYALIAQDTAYDDAGRLNKQLYLYRRKRE